MLVSYTPLYRSILLYTETREGLESTAATYPFDLRWLLLTCGLDPT
jgi:hypothetical protein